MDADRHDPTAPGPGRAGQDRPQEEQEDTEGPLMPTLNWIGKDAVVNHHREVPYHLLRCDAKLSVGDPGSGNLLVQGDNLLALKALLPYYAGQVKCIYIDPPYNTGNENWVYNDNANAPEVRKWLGKVVGAESDDLSRHDKWLCMMYPRLALLREFLRDDGAVFISIADHEIHNLRLLMDEIFGQRNFIANVIWQKVYSPKSSAKHFSEDHDYIVVYARDAEVWRPNLVPRTEEQDKRYKNPDDDPRGPWKTSDLSARNPYSAGTYSITCPSGRVIDGPPRGRYWSVSKENFEKLDKDNRIWWGKSGNSIPQVKRFLSEIKQGAVPQTLWPYQEVGHTQDAKKELLSICDFEDSASVFITPKPLRLIQRILQVGTDEDSIILDSFAGSGTTGHAVLQANKADGGNRRFIMVEMEENICRDVTAQRLTRAVEGYTATNGSKEKEVPGLGGGFRYCKLSHPIFDAEGQIHEDVRFADLAAHVFFTETGEPIPKRPSGKQPSPLLGVCNGTAVYLLFNGVLGDKRPDGGNVLTSKVLEDLPAHDGPKVIYGEGCRLGAARLKRAGITFKQVPYEIKVS
jgi:site-specific DNA-methyltransferase (adenine-specific)/adenine-specific DNA-methyltransferase